MARPNVPKAQFPNAAATQYYRRIRKLVDKNRKKTWDTWTNSIRPRIHDYRRRMDDGVFVVDEDELTEIEKILEQIRQWSEENVFAPGFIEELSRNFIEQLNESNRSQFREQVETVIGIDPTARETWLRDFMNIAVSENVSWIKSIDKEYHDKIKTITLQGVRRGRSINDMAQEITKASESSKSRAKFIARDQAGSIYGDLTKTRQEQMGLKKFRWSTSDDERVRESHAELDGRVFTWKDGANRIYPGEDYNCRCVAEPLEDELFEID